MRRFLLITCALVIIASATAALQQPPASAPANRPNIVYIMSDDLGYGDLASFGSADIKSPNIDSIGRDGVRLTDAYANGVLCSPTRAALIAGRYPQRYAIENALGDEGSFGLKVTGQSMPQLLKNAGYATALVGKWHLAGTVEGDQAMREGGPRAHGFEYFWGFMGSHDDYWWHNRGPRIPDLWENETRITTDGYLTDLFTEKAVAHVEQSVAAGQPFFLDLSYSAPHWPYNRPDVKSPAPGSGAHITAAAENAPTRADYVAMVESMDRGVGRVLQALQRLNVANNTLVIFTNDNGGEWLSDPGPLSDRKWTVYEGGVRVPALVKWPGRIPARRTSAQPVITMDWSATILAAAGVSKPATYEGIDVVPIISGRQPQVERTFFWRAVPGNRNQRAVRRGDWKLIVDGNHTKVFNVREDPGEREDLTRARQAIARQLNQLLQAWTMDVNAEAAVNAPIQAAQIQAQLGGRAGGARAGGAAAPGGRGGAAAPNPAPPAGNNDND